MATTGTITSLGSGSGLDLQGILDKLQASEETQLTVITARQDSYQAKLSAYGQLQSSVSSLQKAADALNDPNTFNAVTGTSTASDIVDVRTSAGAVPSDYAITISQLATTQRLQSEAQTSRIDNIGSGGTISVTIGTGTNATTQSVTLGSDTSLNGIVKAINGQDKLGVTASIVSDGNNNYYLMLNSKTTGTDAAMTKVEVTGNTALSDVLSYDAADPTGATHGMAEQQAAQNAQFTVNGIAATSQSNTASKVIDGVTIILKGTTQTDSSGNPTPVTLSVTRDTTSTAASIQAFVDAYNSLNSTISTLTSFDVDNETQSALTGDSTARSIQNAMASALRVFASGNGAIQSLADIGITTNYKDGTLSVDSTKLNNALTNNLGDVTKLFSGDSGLATRVDTAANGILGSNGNAGTLAASQESIQNTIDDLKKQYTETQDRINATIDTYRQQFTQLDALVAQMNSMSSYLTQQFAAMSGSNSKK